jgi:hypothetical protein
MRDVRKLVLALLVVAVAMALSACGSSDGSTTTSGGTGTGADSGKSAPEAGMPAGKEDVPTIVVRDGEPVGGIQELEYSAGEEIRFRVSSDAAEEIHVHGYDLMKEVPAGGTVEFDFPAELEGIYEAELEGLGIQIVELRINP